MTDTAVDRTPAYVTITQRLRESIANGAIPQGAVLLEGPLADIFGSSRSPVKQALATLEDEGILRRFDGRGLVVGKNVEPSRIKITPALLQTGSETAEIIRPFAWQSIYYAFEREITLCSLFGRFKVNELALARHFSVGRTVARDLLLHAQLTGLVEKGEKARWWTVALDEKRFDDLYELRVLLEPAALETAVVAIPADILDQFHQRLSEANVRFPDIDQSELDAMENELHIDCLGYTTNIEICEALRRSRCTLIAGKHIQTALERTPFVDPFMDEHIEIIEAIKQRRIDAAKAALLHHLKSSRLKAQERSAMYRSRHSLSMVEYITD